MIAMPYNLLHKRWIPVSDGEGNTWDIAPHEMTKPGPNNTLPVALNAPRPDFNGALIQFLIGLVQTACPPATERQWRLWFKKPPTWDCLARQFEPYVKAFYLDENPVKGESGLFMQDYDFVCKATALKKLEDWKRIPISYLLLDTPTVSPDKRKGLSHRERFDTSGKQHFNKNRYSWYFSAPAAAMALLTMQINAPAGGAGYRVSMRGMGPLSTVILGRTLWQTVWLNVLTQDEFETLCGTNRNKLSDIFPWMAPAPTSEAKRLTTPLEVHAAQMYWSTPRRKLLLKSSENEACTLLMDKDAQYVHYYRQNLGVDYDNSSVWPHPLSPQNLRNGKPTTPVKTGQCSGLSYRHWLALATSRDAQDVRSALVVRKFLVRAGYRAVRDLIVSDDDQEEARNDLERIRPRLWAFGYEIVNNNKAQAWHDSQIPLFILPPEHRLDFEGFAHQLVSAASLLVQGVTSSDPSLRLCLKRGLFGSYQHKNGKLKWDFPASKKEALTKSVVDNTGARFWRDTEPWFYNRLQDAQGALKEALEQGDEPEIRLTKLRKEWAEQLRKHALKLFDDVTGYGTFHGADPKSVAKARIALDRFCNWQDVKNGKKLRAVLDLKAPQKKNTKPKRG